jgi:tol-pal system protein YbgF
MRRARGLYAFLPLGGALLLGGCVSGSDIERVQRQINGVEKKVDALAVQASSREEVQKLSENLGRQSTALLRSNAEIGTKFDELTRDLQTLAGKLEDANRRLREVSQQLGELQARMGGAAAAPPASGGAPAASPGPPAKGATPADLFTQATADYQRGQFDLARQGFQEYVDTFPKTDLSDDAAYWIGECYAAQKKPREAIAAWERLIRQYPNSDKGAAAHLKKGLAHLDLGEKAQAIVEIQFVVHEYPRSDEAKSARQRLRTLGADVR